MKRVYVAIAILLIGCCVLSILLYNANNNKTALSLELQTTKEDLSKLQTSYQNLLQEKDELETQIKEGEISPLKENLRRASNSSRRSSANALTTSDVFETQIDGDFEGWEGETIFKMTNGTIWQQNEYSYTYIIPICQML